MDKKSKKVKIALLVLVPLIGAGGLIYSKVVKFFNERNKKVTSLKESQNKQNVVKEESKDNPNSSLFVSCGGFF